MASVNFLKVPLSEQHMGHGYILVPTSCAVITSLVCLVSAETGCESCIYYIFTCAISKSTCLNHNMAELT